MKKIFLVTLLSSMLLILSGCGSSGNDAPPVVEQPPVEEPLPPEELNSVDLYDLDAGYSIGGYNNMGELVVLEYCKGEYVYYRDSEFFNGNFDISNNGATINMYDSDGGSYVIDTENGLIEVGYSYYIFDINNDISVEAIETIPDC